MITFKEFLNERVSQTKPTEKRKVTKEELRDMILKGEDISDVDTSEIVNMNRLFWGMKDLEIAPELDTSNAKYMNYMFEGCSSLKYIPAIDTSKVTNMAYIFRGCNSIETIERPSDWYLYDWNSSNAPKHLKNKYPELYNKELR